MVGEGGVEDILGCAERERPGAQEAQGEGVELGGPAGDDGLQVREVGRPQVGTFEAPIVGDARAALDRGALFADIDLFPPVDVAVGELAADARVTAELRAVDVLDRELLPLGEGEEAAGHIQDVVDERLRDAVPDEVEETHLVGGLAQLLAEPSCRLLAVVEGGHVEDGEGI